MIDVYRGDPVRLRSTGVAVDVGKGPSDNHIWCTVHRGQRCPQSITISPPEGAMAQIGSTVSDAQA
jgi:hypothetical protein